MTRWLLLSEPFIHDDDHASGKGWTFIDADTPEAAVEAWEGRAYAGKDGEWWLIGMDDDAPIRVTAAGHYERVNQ